VNSFYSEDWMTCRGSRLPVSMCDGASERLNGLATCSNRLFVTFPLVAGGCSKVLGLMAPSVDKVRSSNVLTV
jgi:hypothetical protein